MAAVSSLGVHTPVALPYLVDEGILPPDPSPHLYKWDTFLASDDDGNIIEEEIIATKHVVIWSQANFIRNVYRFEVEGEHVIQATLTQFPASSGHETHGELLFGSTRTPRERPWLSENPTSNEAGRKHEWVKASSARALVVLLRSKAHIYFFNGASHVVDLPFEISRAFPAPRGLVLQRKRTAGLSQPPTPQIPSAPPNSFFSSQLRVSQQSYLQSPTLLKSFSTRPQQPSPLSGDTGMEALFQSVIVPTPDKSDEDVTNLYTLCGPLSDLGVVTYAMQSFQPRSSTRSQAGMNIDFVGLDPGEEVLYVSPRDELMRHHRKCHAPLTFLVTFNADTHSISVWHAWYIQEKSLKALLKVRAEHKAAKSRRRSSFMSVSAATGATTPAFRRREGARESFATAGQGLSQPEQVSNHGAGLPRKPTRQEEEQAMASQMDPDFQPAPSQQPAREGRRISSINADVRASQATVGASFTAAAGRRAPSFGAHTGRRSLSHRKSRGSTPGSTYGQSLGIEHDTMDVDTTIDFDTEDNAESILREMRATLEVTGLDTVFGSAVEDFRRELVVSKLHSFSVGLRSSQRSSPSPTSNDFRVATLLESQSISGTEDPRPRIFVHDGAGKEVRYTALKVTYAQLWPEMRDSPTVAIPSMSGEGSLGPCDDLLRLTDGDSDALLLAGRGVQLSLDDEASCTMPPSECYRVYHALNFLQDGEKAKDVGKNRTVGPPSQLVSVTHSGLSGSYDEVGPNAVHHRRALQLQPRNKIISQLLTVLELMLPKYQARTVRKVWCTAYSRLEQNPDLLLNTSGSHEFVAFVTSLFSYLLSFLDAKARAAVQLAHVAVGKTATGARHGTSFHKSSHGRGLLSEPAWSWMSQPSSDFARQPPRTQEKRKDQLLVVAASLAEEVSHTPARDNMSADDSAIMLALRMMLSLHVIREEYALSNVSADGGLLSNLAVVIAQLGAWLNLSKWTHSTGGFYDSEGASEQSWTFIRASQRQAPNMSMLEHPFSAYQWFEHALRTSSAERYPTLTDIARIWTHTVVPTVPEFTCSALTPRLHSLSSIVASSNGLKADSVETVEILAQHNLTVDMLETFPEAIAAPLMEAVIRCEKEPPTTWGRELLQLVGRVDLDVGATTDHSPPSRPATAAILSPRDIHAACSIADDVYSHTKTKEAHRHSISRLIFSEDRRLIEAIGLMRWTVPQRGYCPKQPDWDEQTHFDQQRRVMHYVTLRMIALPTGHGMLHYDSQSPLLTEKYTLPGFSSSCLMLPMRHTLTADRSGLNEEKVNWAYFHAGVSVGIRISHTVTGIDTSWICFNKPNDLTNRHAGLLLALGLGGHLRSVAKWLSFKYLCAKHTMTSVGLLLGLSASHIGTMDGLITKMLSVHITKMLPSGAADVNVSPATQTAGLLGMGLLYYDTQHRRFSEMMLTEIEFMEVEDPDSGPDPLRDESYRLAAGFALGLINLGKGDDLRGLHGMQMAERLLAMAVGPRPVNAVHVFDRATAGAVMALALVYMKSGDQSVATKIDIPDTETQFDHVRPDILMLRAMTKHVILWDEIKARGPTYESGWIHENLPACYKKRSKQALEHMRQKRNIDSAYIPLFNVFTGLAWALSLKYAGSGNIIARDEILTLLDFFHTLSAGADAFYFDGKLGRASLRRCMDVLALAAATVMAGTGDLDVFRYLRRMHGRTDADTPYGSHVAAHLAIGVLFLAGGTYTFRTSDLAIASLIIAFYPLFPADVSDNRVHLQAFRHLWVLAAEARCIVVEDIDTQRPIHMPIKVVLRDGEVKQMRAPCLLPELHTIATVQTDDPTYWRVTLDFAGNPTHLAAFKRDQKISVRRCPASEAHDSTFAAALAAFTDMSLAAQPNHTQAGHQQELFQSLLTLPAFDGLTRADVELLLPPDVNSSVYTDERTTVVDDRLVFSKAVKSNEKKDLWNLRTLFAWAERLKDEGKGEMRWLGEEVVQELKASIEERVRAERA